MGAVDFVLRALGVFYLLGGGITVRAAMTSRFLDKAIAQISLRPIPHKDTLQFAWLVANAVLIAFGGIAAVLLWSGAAILFLLGAAGQLLYLTVLAPRYFDQDDPPDAAGRQRTRNAFLIHLAATALVVAAFWSGGLRETAALDWQDGTIAGALSLLGLAIPFGGRLRFGKRSSTPVDSGDDEMSFVDRPARPPGVLPKRIVLMAEIGGWPTWEYDIGLEAFDPAELSLSSELADAIASWADDFNDSLDMDDPGGRPRWDEARYLAHHAQGRALAERLAQELAARGDGYIDIGYWDPDEGTVWINDAPRDADKSAGGG